MSIPLRVGRTTSIIPDRPVPPERDAVRCRARLLAHLAERLPQHIRQETDEDVSQDAIFLLVPDRADLEITLVNAEGRFRLGQLNVRFPQLFVAPVGDVGAKNVAAGAECGPVARRFDFLPLDTSVALFLLS